MPGCHVAGSRAAGCEETSNEGWETSCLRPTATGAPDGWRRNLTAAALGKTRGSP
jgi:hypothetical protein